MTVETLKSPIDLWLDKADVKWLNDKGDLVPPKTVGDNLRFRDWLLDLEAADPDGKARRKILSQCEDINFFFNAFLWTHDTRLIPKSTIIPFITYKYQDEYISWIVNHIVEKKDCLTEKSRDMGMSWCLMGIILHGWLFKPGFLAHLGSKKEDDVDRSGDMRSLFEKLRYMLKYLPKWLQPYTLDTKKHSMHLRLINPDNGSAITGEASGRNFAVSGRYSCIFMDEFSKMDEATEAWTSTADSAPCRVVVSTPNGTGNKFWQLRFKSTIDRFTVHWTLHPKKAEGVHLADKEDIITSEEAYSKWMAGEAVSSPWYENEKNRRLTQESESTIDIAQELDIDYLVSGNPYFDIPKLKKQEEWGITEDWVRFNINNKKVIIGTMTEIDGKIEFRSNKNGWLRLFEKPVQGGQYVGGLDPASGSKGGDFSSGAWREKRTRNLVAGIYGHYDYDELAYFSYLVSRYFNNSLVCAESGGYGSAVNKRLYDLGGNVARTVDLSSGSVIEGDKLGFVTSTKTRPQLLGDIEAEIREGACELRDKELIGECMNFVVTNGKAQASEGSNDDYIFAFGIAGQLIRYRPYSLDLEKNYNKRFQFKKPPPNQGLRFGHRK